MTKQEVREWAEQHWSADLQRLKRPFEDVMAEWSNIEKAVKSTFYLQNPNQCSGLFDWLTCLRLDLKDTDVFVKVLYDEAGVTLRVAPMCYVQFRRESLVIKDNPDDDSVRFISNTNWHSTLSTLVVRAGTDMRIKLWLFDLCALLSRQPEASMLFRNCCETLLLMAKELCGVPKEYDGIKFSDVLPEGVGSGRIQPLYCEYPVFSIDTAEGSLIELYFDQNQNLVIQFCDSRFGLQIASVDTGVLFERRFIGLKEEWAEMVLLYIAGALSTVGICLSYSDVMVYSGSVDPIPFDRGNLRGIRLCRSLSDLYDALCWYWCLNFDEED